MKLSDLELGAITGQAISSIGEPISDAIVMIGEDSPNHHDISAVTNTTGHFSFTDLVPGNYTLLLNTERHGLQKKKVVVQAGSVSHCEFVIAPS